MIDWNVIYWTFIVSCSLPFISMVIDLFRMIILILREGIQHEAFMYRLKHHDCVDQDLLDEARRLSRIRYRIARKYSC